ncbi:hypothetical protein ACFORG_14445 [Lutimaribacter marinistellae]|uniref:Gene transfer agent protein n=1 Tax=Lutimaribacter marinistellae TaxID=1820329 RepID=A0ABV7TH84_9RHOB
MADGPGYPPFDCAPGMKLAAHERVAAIQHEHLCHRLDQLEELIARLERRLWLAVYGVAAAIVGQLFQSILVATP